MTTTKDQTGTFWISTWGCQMNVLDSERTAGLLRASGLDPASAPEVADVVLYMTCSVREKAEMRVRHSLAGVKGLRRRNPDLVVGVLGCVAEQEGAALLQGGDSADLVVGPRQLERLPELIERVRSDREPLTATGFDELSYEPSAIERTAGVTARVTIMEGCNLRCTFCVVPNTRGPEACRSADAIVAEVRDLVARGYQEILLLGQTVNAYRHGETTFARLLRRVDAEAAPRRLRFVSSHPLFFDEEVAGALADCRSLVPWVNLPLQSGSDRVLKRMKRLYRREEYLGRVEILRGAVGDLALNTDIIVGFPGETDDDFAETLAVVREVEFDSMFTYKYSPRPHTPAERLEDDVPDEIKTQRIKTLTEVQAEIQRRRNQRLVGTVQPVLIDEEADGRMRGRTPGQRIVSLPAWEGGRGTCPDVRITGAGVHGLAGELASPVV